MAESDIVDRLKRIDFTNRWKLTPALVVGEAANEITRLRTALATAERERDEARAVVTNAIEEMKLICTDDDKRNGEHRKYYQGVDAARDTLEIYFARLSQRGKE